MPLNLVELKTWTKGSKAFFWHKLKRRVRQIKAARVTSIEKKTIKENENFEAITGLLFVWLINWLANTNKKKIK